MNKIDSNDSDWLFKTNQIVCLEYQTTCLYGEVIQLVPSRGICWFRPICMTQKDPECDRPMQIVPFVQLESADLLWPACLFRPAWDTEVIFLFTELGDGQKSQETQLSSRQHLHQFIRKVWAANQDKFE